MEIILLIIAILLSASSVVVGIVDLALSKARRKTYGGDFDVLGELETLNNNLNEVKNLVNEHTTREKSAQTESIINTLEVTNAAMSSMIDKYLNSFKDILAQNINATKENLSEIRQEMKEATKDMGNNMASSLESLKKDMQGTLDRLSKTMEASLDKIGENLKASLKEVRDDNKSQLEMVRDNNTAQLERIRETVDEKLTATLNSRIASAFEVVTKSLDNVQQGFGEMRELTGQVGNLNKMFSNVKTRGGWGEVQLESLLDQILSPGQYQKQFRIDKKTQELVDFVIVMPGKSGEKTPLYLPIDCKLPLDRYTELVGAADSGDVDRIESARKELIGQIKREAKSISQKYIKTPDTTPFAIMYLPSEGLYAEVAKNSALISTIQNENNVMICGPTTITSILNSLQMGFTTLKIQKRSSEIAETLRQFQKDFKKYSDLVAKIKKNATTVVTTIEDVERQNNTINKRLSNIGEQLPDSQDDTKLIASDADDTGDE